MLTFNGPSGFATDIGSEMVFDFQQTLLQRDVRFEQLTQTERDVIYAARDYLRFRKQLFRDISGLYYNLLVSYRGIEINAQDYFTTLRGLSAEPAEYRTAEKSRVFKSISLNRTSYGRVATWSITASLSSQRSTNSNFV